MCCGNDKESAFITVFQEILYDVLEKGNVSINTDDSRYDAFLDLVLEAFNASEENEEE